MARALGLPLVVGLGEEIFAADEGDTLVLDGEPAQPSRAEQTRLDELARGHRADGVARAGRVATLPAVTRDGRRIRLLCNAGTPRK